MAWIEMILSRTSDNSSDELHSANAGPLKKMSFREIPRRVYQESPKKTVGLSNRTIAKCKLGKLPIVISTAGRNLTEPMEREFPVSWQG